MLLLLSVKCQTCRRRKYVVDGDFKKLEVVPNGKQFMELFKVSSFWYRGDIPIVYYKLELVPSELNFEHLQLLNWILKHAHNLISSIGLTWGLTSVRSETTVHGGGCRQRPGRQKKTSTSLSLARVLNQSCETFVWHFNAQYVLGCRRHSMPAATSALPFMQCPHHRGGSPCSHLKHPPLPMPCPLCDAGSASSGEETRTSAAILHASACTSVCVSKKVLYYGMEGVVVLYLQIKFIISQWDIFLQKTLCSYKDNLQDRGIVVTATGDIVFSSHGDITWSLWAEPSWQNKLVNRIHKVAVYLLYSIMLLVSMKIVNWTPMIAVVYYSGKSSFIAF